MSGRRLQKSQKSIKLARYAVSGPLAIFPYLPLASRLCVVALFKNCPTKALQQGGAGQCWQPEWAFSWWIRVHNFTCNKTSKCVVVVAAVVAAFFLVSFAVLIIFHCCHHRHYRSRCPGTYTSWSLATPGTKSFAWVQC